MAMPISKRIYGNYEVYSPDGILMFRCDAKKANWYLKRNLASQINNFKIKLSFEPNGLGNHNKYGLREMQNICVRCGSENNLNRHHVVPYGYRRYMPIEIKSHNFHDVLSLCVECHEEYERYADILKNDISIEYNAPIFGDIEERKGLVKYIRIASTLLRTDISLPKEKEEQLKCDIKDFFNIKRLTTNRLEQISNLETRIVKKTHGEIVIESLDNIESFIVLWRKHFVNNMKPKYLPIDWDINTNVYINDR